MNIGIYVGSFNPIHKGHISIINYLLNNKIVDQIFLIPTLNYWHKEIKTSLTNRVNMLKLYEQTNILVKDKYSKCQYTYEIFRKLKVDYHETFSLIIGSDSTLEFNKWINVSELLENRIIIIKRNGYEMGNIDLFKNAIIIDNPLDYNYNSSDIRDNLDNINQYCDPKVITYIKKHNLYKI